jgi:hypothetical protein
MDKNNPIYEKSFWPADVNAIPSIKCPHCGATYQVSRVWDNSFRCTCGQLFWRSVKVELSEKLKNAEQVEHFLKKIRALGWVWESRGRERYKLTPYAALVLKDPVSFYAVMNDTDQLEAFLHDLRHSHRCEPLYAHAKTFEDKLPEIIKSQDVDLQRRALLEICAAYHQILHHYPDELNAFNPLHRIAILRGGSLPDPFPAKSQTWVLARRYKDKVKKQPKDPDACVIVYRALTLTDFIDERKDRGKWLSKAFQLDPSNSCALLEKARTRRSRKRQLSDVERAIQSDSNNADAWAFKGQVLAEAKRGGEQEFKKCLDLDPTHIQAKIFVKTGQWLVDAVSTKRWWRFW